MAFSTGLEPAFSLSCRFRKTVTIQLDHENINGGLAQIRTGNIGFVVQRFLQLAYEALKWCSHTESNCEYIPTKNVLYHLTIRALLI